MKTSEILDMLQEGKKRRLSFILNDGRVLPVGYHVTEVKNVQIKSVDCGGRPGGWHETIIQLWVPPPSNPGPEITADKALKIVKTADSLVPMDSQADCFFEVEEASGAAVVHAVSHSSHTPNEISIHLANRKTQCKPMVEDPTACCGKKTDSPKAACCG